MPEQDPYHLPEPAAVPSAAASGRGPEGGTGAPGPAEPDAPAGPAASAATAADGLYGLHNLPYGIFSTADEPDRKRVGVRYGDRVLDVPTAATALGSPHTDVLARPTLNPLMAAGPAVWRAVREDIRTWLGYPAIEPFLRPLPEVTLHLPFEVADYADFYSSEHHATNAGRIFRPHGEPLPANWKHLPIGYHGRAGTVVVSGTPVVRPSGQRRGEPEPGPAAGSGSAPGSGAAAAAGPQAGPPAASAPAAGAGPGPAAAAGPRPVFGPTRRLDIEAEVGFVVGAPSRHGEPVPLSAFREHVFGVCLVNDWSARDIQSWETVPLGPFLGKSFATSVSAWITPLDALDAARTAPPPRDPAPLPYLDDSGEEPGGLDIRIQVALNGHPVAEPPAATLYWTGAQQLAHLTAGGASLRTGDLYASGTVSGPEPGQRGSLLELTWNGRDPLDLPDGKRTFLEDGDEVTLTAWAPGPDGTRVGLGEVTGRIVPS
ncbi:fumarylacetoacetate hydrolase family protein [Streptomyces sp. NPDC048845]|uniref:fumarylacetoacetate hydrolase family protein n=1 Tax=Streptomyces sp. NPDC048845 TaxID=3155390 RepID=UPI00343E5AA1